ncbi:MAG: carbonic anhydrase family protein [Azoarcus sp.]|nr:carbonic anhydrase family protein [Azoarcus sp.]
MAMTLAHADDWEKIVGDRGRTVEIDPASIFESDHGTKVAWGRVVLNDAEMTKSGYRTIKALNRYDCLNRSFVTIKRAYLDDAGLIVREESIADQVPMMVMRNSVDERMWRAVCRPTSSAEPAGGNSHGAAEIERAAAAADRAAKTAQMALVTQIKPATPSVSVASPPPRVAVTANLTPPASAAPGHTPQTNAQTSATSASAPTPAAQPMPRLDPLPAARPPSATRVPPQPAPSVASTPTAVSRAPAPVVFPAPPQARRPAARSASAVKPAAQSVTRLTGNESWSYGNPEQWGKLRPDWRLCGEGRRQSPIEFTTGATVAVDLEPVLFDYRKTRFRTTDTGNMLRVKVDEGLSMTVRGRRYALDSFTLHHPAEERIDGRVAEMSAHFLHRDGEGRQAILAVQLMLGDMPNPLLQTLLNHLPLEKGESYMPEAFIEPDAFLPTGQGHYLYMGSLSMPPCTEEVIWVVMKSPVTLSAAQLEIFTRLHPDNARPPQTANARLVLESR